MNKMFVRTLGAALAALLAMTVVLVIAFSLGYQRSVNQWGKSKQIEAAEIAANLLNGSADPTSVRISDDSPLFVYNDDKELVFSNRGSGRRWIAENESDLTAVNDGNLVVGYFHLGAVQFQENEANAAFVSSMGKFIIVGLTGAIALSVILSLFFSRGLSAPAVALVAGLEKMGSGDLSVRVPENGVDEISSIAHSVNSLAVRLANEQESRRQWIHDITHDLRTPVSAMKAQFEGMADGVLSLDRERIGKNLAEIDRIEALVMDLEELMKLESPELTIEKNRIDLTSLISEVMDRFSHVLSEKGVRLEISPRCSSANADHGLIFRALSNIAANAVRHVNQGGVIRVDTEAHDGEVCISVTNTGTPLTAEDEKKAFRRLYRGDYARNTHGSGLGLTIVSTICALHGGSATLVNVDAADGIGEGVKAELAIPE